MAAAAGDSSSSAAAVDGAGESGGRRLFSDYIAQLRAVAGDLADRGRAAAASAPELFDRGRAVADAALDSAFSAAAAGASTAYSYTSDLLATSANHAELAKATYLELEETAIQKIKEELVLHPGASVGTALAIGLIAFKKPRSFMIQNVRRLFMSDKVMLLNVKPEVHSLKQALDLTAVESGKLMDRSMKAEKRYHDGLNRLKSERKNITKQFNAIKYTEELEGGIRSILKELPEAQELQYRSQVDELASELRAVKRQLKTSILKLDDYDGMPKGK